ncbi:MAG: tRNA (cytidine(56)-2'-O)-methyltransferase [Candidatus Micrarchaeia archaeon]
MIVVLRLGHRISRDKRVSTHCALVARAFGADKIIFSGQHDEKILQTVNKTSEKWGGNFAAEYCTDWKKIITNFDGVKVHLTFYGVPLKTALPKIKTSKNILLVVGSEKVPAQVYGLCDLNVSIGNQPHSEVAALAVFLHELLQKHLKKKFIGWKIKIIPSKAGKQVRKKR